MNKNFIRLSRDRNFLIKSSILVTLLSIMLGFVTQKFAPDKYESIENELASTLPWMNSIQLKKSIEKLGYNKISGILNFKEGPLFTKNEISIIARNGHFRTSWILGIPQNTLSNNEQNLFIDYINCYENNKSPDLTSKLKSYTDDDKPIRFSSEFYADILSLNGNNEEAFQFYKLELRNYPESIHAKTKIIIKLIEDGEYEEAKKKFRDPHFQKNIKFETLKPIAVDLDQWATLTLKSFTLIIRKLSAPWILVTVFAAMVWFTIIVNLGQLSEKILSRTVLYGAAFTTGFFSTFLVLGIVYWQENELGLKSNGEIINDIIYCICGIGLREELCKLLFFSPFLVILRKRKCAMEALACAACVGLGFACSENILYFGSGLENAIFPRFLTANFLHSSLTGIAGLSMFYLISNPQKNWESFLGTFIIVVVAHGAYDALVGVVPALTSSIGIISIVIFALISNGYLNYAKKLRQGKPSKISPLGVFVIGSSLLIGMAWNLSCYLYPMKEVLASIGESTLSLGTLAFIFINQFRHE